MADKTPYPTREKTLAETTSTVFLVLQKVGVSRGATIARQGAIEGVLFEGEDKNHLRSSKDK